jgi:hypothetical protein
MLCMKMVDGEVIFVEDPSMDAAFDRLKAGLKADGVDLDNVAVLDALLVAAFDDEERV